MSLTLLLPLGLAALASVIVPLLIHLIRRPEHQIIPFAALRWLRQSVRPRRRLRFDDFWLLLARLILLCLIALLLAVPVLRGEWRNARNVIAVSSEADLVAARARIPEKNAEWIWLVPGFPSVDTPIKPAEQPQASLLRELDASLGETDHLTVVVADQFAGLDAQRIALGRPVDWLEVAAVPRSVTAPNEVDAAIVAIRSTGVDSSKGLRYLRAATSVWKTSKGNKWQVDDQPASVPLPGKLDALIWVDGVIPDAALAWIRKGGRALVIEDPLGHGVPVWRDPQGDTIASDETVGAGHLVRLRGPLTPSSLPNLLDADFPHRLQTLVLPTDKRPARAHSRDVTPVRIDRNVAERLTSLSSISGLLIALVFLIERVLATRRRAA